MAKKKRLADILIKNLTELRDDLRSGADIAGKYSVKSPVTKKPTRN